MTSKGVIQICHSEESLVAETAFWAKSAGYELVTLASRDELRATGAGNAAAIILELTGSSDEECRYHRGADPRQPRAGDGHHRA